MYFFLVDIIRSMGRLSYYPSDIPFSLYNPDRLQLQRIQGKSLEKDSWKRTFFSSFFMGISRIKMKVFLSQALFPLQRRMSLRPTVGFGGEKKNLNVLDFEKKVYMVRESFGICKKVSVSVCVNSCETWYQT